MKKLSVILSVLLCLSMMYTGVAAAPAGEILTGDDALAIYEKCINKMSGAEYIEIRGFMHETDPVYNPPKEERQVADIKLATDSDGKLQLELEVWNTSGETIGHTFIDGDYMYDFIEKEKYKQEAVTMRGMIYGLTGVDGGNYKSDMENLRAEKLENGYRLRYNSTSYTANDDRFTLVINEDFRLESVANSFSYGVYGDKTTYKYEILSVNRPFKIKFPADLDRYKLM